MGQLPLARMCMCAALVMGATRAADAQIIRGIADYLRKDAADVDVKKMHGVPGWNSYLSWESVSKAYEAGVSPEKLDSWQLSGGTVTDFIVTPVDFDPSATPAPPWGCGKSDECLERFNLPLCAPEKATSCKAPFKCVPAYFALTRADALVADNVCMDPTHQRLLNKIWSVMTGATITERGVTAPTGKISKVDVVSLDPPSGRYAETMMSAILFLQSLPQKDPIAVRMLFSTYSDSARLEIMKDQYIASANPSKANGPHPKASHFLAIPRLLFGLRPRAPLANVTVSFGNYTVSTLGQWNHSKIIVRDGKSSLVGGHNLVSHDYLEANPVHDVSVAVEGDASAMAQRFVDQQWNYVCTWAKQDVTDKAIKYDWVYSVLPSGKTAAGVAYCPDDKTLPPTVIPTPSSTPSILSAGQLGGLERNNGAECTPDTGSSVGEVAQARLIRSAKKSVKLVQQDILPLKVVDKGLVLRGPYPYRTLAAIADRLLADVPVTILYTQSGAMAGQYDYYYSNSYEPSEVACAVADAVAKLAYTRLSGSTDYGEESDSDPRPYTLTETSQAVTKAVVSGATWLLRQLWTGEPEEPSSPVPTANEKLKLEVEKLKAAALKKGFLGHVKLTRFGSKATPNHPKFIMADDSAYYVGSQNIYHVPGMVAGVRNDGHVEFGYIVEDPAGQKGNGIADALAWFSSLESKSRPMTLADVLTTGACMQIERKTPPPSPNSSPRNSGKRPLRRSCSPDPGYYTKDVDGQ